ncbi:MAG TPA: DUF177 domain-containing protein [Thermoanaerobaculia bacterium]|nr:DUF177 domain-containing protein [Thermoanaerobaculia bacterium]
MNDIIRFDEIDEHGPQTYRGTFEISLSEIDRMEVSKVGPAAIEAKVGKGTEAAEYVADGSASFAIDFICARCLEPYPFAASSSFHVRFVPRPEIVVENEEIEIDESGLDVEFYGVREIALRDLAIEQIQLSIPMKTLCDESCLGLCPRCGANWNRETCECGAPAGDERWGALRDIREQMAKKKDL